MRPVKAPIYFEELTYKIIGAAMKVHAELGSIHKEIIYQKALEIELKKQGISLIREVRKVVKYENTIVGNYIPDFVVNDQVVVEIKAMISLPDKAERQLFDYLKAIGYKVGLLINFGASKLEVKRRVWR